MTPSPAQRASSDHGLMQADGPRTNVRFARPQPVTVRGCHFEPGRADSGGTRLRIRALHAMGHSAARIGRAAGADEQVIQRLARGSISSVSLQLRDAIAEVYDAWWDKRPPERTAGERTAAAAARHRAIRGNWCAGAGLDDDLLDQAGYRPAAPWRPATGTGLATDFFFADAAQRREISMNCDPRHTQALVADVLTVLRQHGYQPRDPAHTRRAERLIGDLARIYQGSQDAPSGAYVIAGPLPVSSADSIRGHGTRTVRDPAVPRSGKAVTRD